MAQVFYLPILAVYNQASLPTGVVSLPLLRSVFLRESVDLVHAHAAFSSLGNEALVTAGILGIRTVFTDHSLFGFADVSAILTNKILRFNLVNVTHVICVSHTARENTVLRSGVPPDRVAVIPNAIDPCSFQPDADDPPVDTTTGRVVIVIVSRLVYRKGVDLLVRAIPIVCARFPAVDFVIGGDGPKRVDIEEMRERRNLQDRVRMLGAVPHTGVRDVMCSGDIFLNASLTEAFCIAIVEAASCGMLVVSTAVGGVPEVLPPDIVTLADPTVDGITAAVAIAIARATTRTAAEKRHQHDRVARMYDWRVVALRTQKVYTAALKSPFLRLDQRLGRVYTVGPIAGPILVCYCVVLELLALLLTWLVPVEPRSPLWFTRQDRRGLGTRGAHRGASTRD
jgi:phosphatidylinositol glycan class A protein